MQSEIVMGGHLAAISAHVAHHMHAVVAMHHHVRTMVMPHSGLGEARNSKHHDRRRKSGESCDFHKMHLKARTAFRVLHKFKREMRISLLPIPQIQT